MKEKVEVIDKNTRNLSLDDIEEKMVFYATFNSNDPLTVMMNEKKLAMLERVANLKIKRIQLKALEESNAITTVEPIKVEFISSNTEDQRKRLERIDNEILTKHNA